MTYLLSKFTNRALSKTVAFGDGVFSIADFLRDPGERRDGVRTGGGTLPQPTRPLAPAWVLRRG